MRNTRDRTPREEHEADAKDEGVSQGEHARSNARHAAEVAPSEPARVGSAELRKGPEFGELRETQGSEQKVEYDPDASVEGDRAMLTEEAVFEDIKPYATADTFAAQATRDPSRFPGSALREPAIDPAKERAHPPRGTPLAPSARAEAEVEDARREESEIE